MSGKDLTSKGYIRCWGPGFNQLEHILIAEKALGKQLPKDAEVHHIDGDRTNNKNSNLIVCPSTEYHRLLHCRARALDACGHADWLRCIYCKKWDKPENLFYKKYTYKKHRITKSYHRVCYNTYMRMMNKRRKDGLV